MFSLFTKKRHPVSELYNHYSEEEKLTILATLFLAGVCDNDIVTSNRINAELRFLNQWVKIFEVKAKYSQELLNRLGPEGVIQRLASFEKSKIETVLLMIMEMFTYDGQINDKETNFLLTALDLLNISLADFMEQMEYKRSLYNTFIA